MNTTHAWAARAVHPTATVIAVEYPSGPRGPELLTLTSPGGTTRAVLRTASAPALLATEASALLAAAEAGIPAPRLIAYDETGADAGTVAVLSTFVPGSSLIAAAPDAGRLRAVGRVAAMLATKPARASPNLPWRDRSLSDVEFDHSTSPLLTQARAVLDELPVPDGPRVLVHGDLWQGNTMWAGNTLTAVIDWDSAGVGHPGIDLGNLRCDAAVLYGPSAASAVLDGWRETADDPDWLPYYDILAAICTPADMGYFMPPLHRQGRTDLDAHTAVTRRDAYLREALDAIGW
ncbi:aminoglycoside phosphotransferase family protein [Labedaea rhizosphaerae]|uniref:Phosphotransferase family enzyme n=1 Tax=Labedaea rhizosphaerae TaxID=598644 RepID=A0A4R6SBX6_LABRH|nr:aminoglycoside phosphotransferase family protein [Labedaea rhizosphaerae]TDP97053.1 phosphotransferase family enzyme [Labedaea rhizosphaerae]